MKLTEDVIQAFNVSGEVTPLSGGRNTSLKANNLVLKPVENVFHSEMLLSIIDNIHPQGYRLSKPIRSKSGSFVYKGWICTQFERGKEMNGLVKEKLEVSRLFHHDLRNVDIGTLPQTADHPWAKAHRIAWQANRMSNEIHTKAQQIINDLLTRVRLREEYTLQIIHADLAGNILFDDVLPPLVIDFSPTLAPIEYAEAILVCDCIAWQRSQVAEIDVLPKDGFHKEMILRAVIFRLAAEAILSGKNIVRFDKQYDLFKPILEYINY